MASAGPPARRPRPTKCFVRVAPLGVARRACRPGLVHAHSAELRLHETPAGEPVLIVPDVEALGKRRPGAAYRCDGVFDGECDDEIYTTVGAPLVELALKGSSSCIVAYGQTGSGKSYNLWRVIIPGLIEALFGAGANVRVAAQQIYCDRIEDIMPQVDEVSPPRRHPKRDAPVLRRYTMPEMRMIEGGPLRSVMCTSASQMRQVLSNVADKVRTASTWLNQTSSRSHTLLHFQVEVAGATGHLAVVDLAGSERLKKSGSVGVQQQEAIAINASLHALSQVQLQTRYLMSSGGRAKLCLRFSQVIEAVGRRKSHIPTRGSMLTQMLDRYVRGGDRLHLLVCISPLKDHLSETIHSMQFAQSAMRLQEVEIIVEPRAAEATQQWRPRNGTLEVGRLLGQYDRPSCYLVSSASTPSSSGFGSHQRSGDDATPTLTALSGYSTPNSEDTSPGAIRAGSSYSRTHLQIEQLMDRLRREQATRSDLERCLDLERNQVVRYKYRSRRYRAEVRLLKQLVDAYELGELGSDAVSDEPEEQQAPSRFPDAYSPEGHVPPTSHAGRLHECSTPSRSPVVRRLVDGCDQADFVGELPASNAASPSSSPAVSLSGLEDWPTDTWAATEYCDWWSSFGVAYEEGSGLALSEAMLLEGSGPARGRPQQHPNLGETITTQALARRDDIEQSESECGHTGLVEDTEALDRTIVDHKLARLGDGMRRDDMEGAAAMEGEGGEEVLSVNHAATQRPGNDASSLSLDDVVTELEGKDLLGLDLLGLDDAASTWGSGAGSMRLRGLATHFEGGNEAIGLGGCATEAWGVHKSWTEVSIDGYGHEDAVAREGEHVVKLFGLEKGMEGQGSSRCGGKSTAGEGEEPSRLKDFANSSGSCEGIMKLDCIARDREDGLGPGNHLGRSRTKTAMVSPVAMTQLELELNGSAEIPESHLGMPGWLAGALAFMHDDVAFRQTDVLNDMATAGEGSEASCSVGRKATEGRAGDESSKIEDNGATRGNSSGGFLATKSGMEGESLRMLAPSVAGNELPSMLNNASTERGGDEALLRLVVEVNTDVPDSKRMKLSGMDVERKRDLELCVEAKDGPLVEDDDSISDRGEVMKSRDLTQEETDLAVTTPSSVEAERSLIMDHFEPATIKVEAFANEVSAASIPGALMAFETGDPISPLNEAKQMPLGGPLDGTPMISMHAEEEEASDPLMSVVIHRGIPSRTISFDVPPCSPGKMATPAAWESSGQVVDSESVAAWNNNEGQTPQRWTYLYFLAALLLAVLVAALAIRGTQAHDLCLFGREICRGSALGRLNHRGPMKEIVGQQKLVFSPKKALLSLRKPIAALRWLHNRRSGNIPSSLQTFQLITSVAPPAVRLPWLATARPDSDQSANPQHTPTSHFHALISGTWGVSKRPYPSSLGWVHSVSLIGSWDKGKPRRLRKAVPSHEIVARASSMPGVAWHIKLVLPCGEHLFRYRVTTCTPNFPRPDCTTSDQHDPNERTQQIDVAKSKPLDTSDSFSEQATPSTWASSKRRNARVRDIRSESEMWNVRVVHCGVSSNFWW